MLIFSRDKNRPISTREDMTMRYSNYIFDLYATLIDIHTDQKPIEFWRRIAAIMDTYGAVYEPLELRTRYRQLIDEHEIRLAGELCTEFPEIDLGDVFKELLLSPPTYKMDVSGGIQRAGTRKCLIAGAAHLPACSDVSRESSSSCIRIQLHFSMA